MLGYVIKIKWIEQEWNLDIWDNMDLEGIMLSLKKSDRERQNTVWFHLLGETKQMNKCNKRETELKQTGSCQRGGW